MRKLIVLFLATALLVLPAAGVFASGGQEGGDGGRPFIGVSVPSADHGWTGAVIDYAEESVRELPIDGRVLTAADVNKQANDIEDLIAQGADAIVLLPLEGDPLTPAAQSVLDAGIPLVNFDREVADEAYTALVKGDNRGIGVNAGEWLVDKLGGEGKVFMLSGPPVSVTTQRDNGFRDAIEGSDLEVVGLQDGGYQREKGYTVMQNALVAYPEIDAVFSIDDEMSLGALQAIKEAGRTDIKYLTGAGGEKNFFEAIMDEDIRSFDGHTIEMATFLYQPNMIQDSIEVALQIVNGEDVDTVTVIPAARVDESNVEQYYDEDSPY
jgi:ribose transport system substrate-binding protein